MKLAGTKLWEDVSERLNLKADKGQSRRQRIATHLRKAIEVAGYRRDFDSRQYELTSAFIWQSTPQGQAFWENVCSGHFE